MSDKANHAVDVERMLLRRSLTVSKEPALVPQSPG